jgi:ABC-type Mn2+/Zn2+ transport system ATPase subunit
MAADEVILRFEEVSFQYGHNKSILDSVDCSVRRGSKITIMGQNGAGKSTIFALIMGVLKPESGQVIIGQKVTIATAKQVIPRAQKERGKKTAWVTGRNAACLGQNCARPGTYPRGVF